jgi:hypothetical protein
MRHNDNMIILYGRMEQDINHVELSEVIDGFHATLSGCVWIRCDHSSEM